MSAGPRAVADSMSLLTEAMEHPLDPGYAAAAAQRGERPASHGRSLLTLVVLLVLGLVLSAAGLQARGQRTSRIAEREALVAEINRQDAAANRLQRTTIALQGAIEAERLRRLDQQSQTGLADEVTRLGLSTGAVAVSGPGIVLTVQDAASSAKKAGGDPRADDGGGGGKDEDGRVLDQDLQSAVNGLWAAGAEAVSINGQRLTALSAIRSAGQAILVDYRPLRPPYRILALGDADRLPSRFTEGRGGRDLKFLADNYGVRYELTAAASLTLPPSAGLDVRRAQPLPDPGVQTSPPPATDQERRS